jgi:hypothetical protein
VRPANPRGAPKGGPEMAAQAAGADGRKTLRKFYFYNPPILKKNCDKNGKCFKKTIESKTS